MQIKSIAPTVMKRQFNLAQANELLPLIYHITETHHKKVKSLLNRLQAVRGSNAQLVSELESQVTAESQKWELKLKRLGLVPKGMWLADFDSGTGYYCWKFPENEIRFWHQYQDGFSGRMEIQ